MCRQRKSHESPEKASDLVIGGMCIKREKVGVWDYYEKINPKSWGVPGSGLKEQLNTLQHDFPYAWHMLKDISSIQSIWIIFPTYVGIGLLLSFLYASNLWYSGQLLKSVSRVNLINYILTVTRIYRPGRDGSGGGNRQQEASRVYHGRSLMCSHHMSSAFIWKASSRQDA